MKNFTRWCLEQTLAQGCGCRICWAGNSVCQRVKDVAERIGRLRIKEQAGPGDDDLKAKSFIVGPRSHSVGVERPDAEVVIPLADALSAIAESQLRLSELERAYYTRAQDHIAMQDRIAQATKALAPVEEYRARILKMQGCVTGWEAALIELIDETLAILNPTEKVPENEPGRERKPDTGDLRGPAKSPRR